MPTPTPFSRNAHTVKIERKKSTPQTSGLYMDVFTLSMVKTGRSGDDVLSVAKREVSSLTSFRTRSWLSACTSRREEGIHSDFEQ